MWEEKKRIFSIPSTLSLAATLPLSLSIPVCHSRYIWWQSYKLTDVDKVRECKAQATQGHELTHNPPFTILPPIYLASKSSYHHIKQNLYLNSLVFRVITSIPRPLTFIHHFICIFGILRHFSMYSIRYHNPYGKINKRDVICQLKNHTFQTCFTPKHPIPEPNPKKYI